MITGKFLAGLISGLATGTALGILFAPEKGSITRKQISKKGEVLLDNLKAKFEDFLLTATNELEDAKSEAEDVLDKVKEKAYEAKNEIENKLDDLLDNGIVKTPDVKYE